MDILLSLVYLNKLATTWSAKTGRYIHQYIMSGSYHVGNIMNEEVKTSLFIWWSIICTM